MNKPKGVVDLARRGFCSGCGVCAVYDKEKISMNRLKNGTFMPKIKTQDSSAAMEVCPFGNETENEDTIGRRLFQAQAGNLYEKGVGNYLGTFIGYDNDIENRMRSTSGGITTWVMGKLLEENLVQGIICVSQTTHDSPYFHYTLACSRDDLINSKKTRYYPCTLESALLSIESFEGKVAVVGLPCFIKAIRLLQIKSEFWNEKIPYCVSLFCGHLKSANYTDYLIENAHADAAVHKSNVAIQSIDYRLKGEMHPANTYIFSSRHREQSGAERQINFSLSGRYGTNWSYSLFMLKCCSFCDDLVGETSDISCGDAWIPPFRNDFRGTNAVVVRNSRIKQILMQAVQAKEITLIDVNAKTIVETQSGGLRHRQDYLGFRLFISKFYHNWVPKKRYEISSRKLSLFEAVIQILRILMRVWSHKAWSLHQQYPFLSFKWLLLPLILPYDSIYQLKSYFKSNSKSDI